MSSTLWTAPRNSACRTASKTWSIWWKVWTRPFWRTRVQIPCRVCWSESNAEPADRRNHWLRRSSAFIQVIWSVCVHPLRRLIVINLTTKTISIRRGSNPRRPARSHAPYALRHRDLPVRGRLKPDVLHTKFGHAPFLSDDSKSSQVGPCSACI